MRIFQMVEESIEPSLGRVNATADELRRYQQALAARERRSEVAMASLMASHEELRASIGVLQQATQSLKREVGRLSASGIVHTGVSHDAARTAAVAPSLASSLQDSAYVGFEDQFRGTQEDIRERVREYLSIFEGATDVLDVGCGRGEFLELLRKHGIRARGIDVNSAMVDVCREQGLDATHADALAYLEAQPDGSLGGLFAAQVI